MLYINSHLFFVYLSAMGPSLVQKVDCKTGSCCQTIKGVCFTTCKVTGMGSCQSSMSCKQLTHSFNNCFGVVPEPAGVAAKKAASLNGDNLVDQTGNSQVAVKSLKRNLKIHTSTREACCPCHRADGGDSPPYDSCVVSANVQVSQLTLAAIVRHLVNCFM